MAFHSASVFTMLLVFVARFVGDVSRLLEEAVDGLFRQLAVSKQSKLKATKKGSGVILFMLVLPLLACNSA